MIMKYTMMVLSLVLLAALCAPTQSTSASQRSRQENRSDRHSDHSDSHNADQKDVFEGRDWPERDEIRQTYELAPGARVEVERINGTVDIETFEGSGAEVHIVRSARNREDLNYKKILVEATGGGLAIRGEKENDRWGSDRRNVKHRVVLKLPRRIDLNVGGVNGRVNVGEVDGPVVVSGINGRVEVGQAVGYTSLSGINGAVGITIAQLGDRGIDVSGINGRVELRFTEDLNADLDVTGINGSVQADVPNVTVQGKMSRSNFRAKIGTGGTRINVSGINGGVRLVRAGSAG